MLKKLMCLEKNTNIRLYEIILNILSKFSYRIPEKCDGVTVTVPFELGLGKWPIFCVVQIIFCFTDLFWTFGGNGEKRTSQRHSVTVYISLITKHIFKS